MAEQFRRDARAPPPPLLRRGRAGAQLLARGRAAAHGAVAAERGDPAAGGGARRAAVRAHDARPCGSLPRASGCSPTACRRSRRSTARSRTRRGPGAGVLGTLRIGSSPAARYELRPALLARVREALPDVEVERRRRRAARSPRAARPAARRRVAVLLRTRCPGLTRRRLSDDAVHVLMRRSHRLAGWDSVSIEALRGDRFVVPGEDLNGGFHRRLRGAVRLRAGDGRRGRDLGRGGMAGRRRCGHAHDRALGASSASLRARSTA